VTDFRPDFDPGGEGIFVASACPEDPQKRALGAPEMMPNGVPVPM